MRNKTTATVLAFFLGGLGIHRFYLNQILLGSLYLIFSWTFIPIIIAFVDFVVLITMSKEKFESKYSKTKAVDCNNRESELISGTSKVITESNRFSLNENRSLLSQERQPKQEVRYVPSQIQGQGVQLLESLSILNATKGCY
ncbi:MAG: TM2 domain-containing protein [Mangrovibacterium sp.]